MKRGITADENRAAILADLDRRGVLYDLNDDGDFIFCDAAGTLSAEFEYGLHLCADGLTAYLRRQRGLCVSCGRAKATRPRYGGAIETAPARWRERFPCWCSSCYKGGAWKLAPRP